MLFFWWNSTLFYYIWPTRSCGQQFYLNMRIMNILLYQMHNNHTCYHHLLLFFAISIFPYLSRWSFKTSDLSFRHYYYFMISNKLKHYQLIQLNTFTTYIIFFHGLSGPSPIHVIYPLVVLWRSINQGIIIQLFLFILLFSF